MFAEVYGSRVECPTDTSGRRKPDAPVQRSIRRICLLLAATLRAAMKEAIEIEKLRNLRRKSTPR
jgi:hypothetical protein